MSRGHPSQISDVKTFFEGQYHMFTRGEVADGKAIIRNIDSFYAKNKVGTPLCLSMVYSSKSMDYYLTGVYDSGLLYVDSALNIIEHHRGQEGYESGYLNALVGKARLLFATNHFNQAHKYFFKARQVG